MLGCRPSRTPVIVKKVKKDNEETGNGNPKGSRKYRDADKVDKGRNKRLLGKLTHLSYTRPNIAFVVSVATQHMHLPRRKHMEEALQILSYLKGTPGHCLFFRKTTAISMEVYIDADCFHMTTVGQLLATVHLFGGT